MSRRIFEVVVIGVPEAVELLAADGITDIAELPAHPALRPVFDEDTHTWSVRTLGNRTIAGRILLRDTLPDDDPAGYLGVAAAGRPNCFTVSGSGRIRSARLRHALRCLHQLAAAGATRIELRPDVAPVSGERSGRWFWWRMARRAPTAFALTSSWKADGDDDVHDHQAVVEIEGVEHGVRVRLTGHLDPIDGHYHWRGMVSGALPADVLTRSRPVTVTIGEHHATGRITERTPQGGYAIAGLGAPPFPLAGAEPVPG